MKHLLAFETEFVKNFLLSKNILSYFDEYKNAHQRLKLKCLTCGFFGIDNKGWYAILSNLKNKNRGCPNCAGILKYSHDYVKSFLDNVNIVLLTESKDYLNSKQKLLVACKKCRFSCKTWSPSFVSIRVGKSSCPVCKPNKTQLKLFNILKVIFDKYDIFYNYKEFDWLKDSCKFSKPLEIDIFIKDNQSDFTLAVEYDGRQHFEPVADFGGIKEFRKIKKRDLSKNKLILEHPEYIKYFIRIPYWEKITEENVKRILRKSGVL